MPPPPPPPSYRPPLGRTESPPTGFRPHAHAKHQWPTSAQTLQGPGRSRPDRDPRRGSPAPKRRLVARRGPRKLGRRLRRGNPQSRSLARGPLDVSPPPPDLFLSLRASSLLPKSLFGGRQVLAG